MEFMNGSGKDIDTLFPDNLRYFELLAMLVDEEPLEASDRSRALHDAGDRHREGQGVQA